MYKLICADMDGTVLDDKKKISERTLRSINMAEEQGTKFAVATGRIFQSACYFGDIIGVTTPVIASNGAVIMDKDGGGAVFESRLGRGEYMTIYRLFLKHGINPHFYSTDTIYSGRLEFSSLSYKTSNERMPENRRVKVVIVEDWDAFFSSSPKLIKAMAIDKDGERIRRAKEEFKTVTDFQVVSSMKNSFEVMKKEASKGLAIKRLCDYYGIDRSDVIAIGDSENDLSMIQYAGLGVAMGNADELLKERADYITEDNNNDGVARVIEKFVLESTAMQK